jgi:predicted HTH transcriptional regulator
MPLPSRLSDVTQAHLEQLIGEAEGQHLDFKRELPINWDQEAKKRFMSDVVAFANSGGGDLVFGMDEGPGAVGGSLVPQRFDNVDAEVRRIQEFLLDLADPRLPGTQVSAVPVAVGETRGHSVVVRVPQSWSAPHRSKANSHFYVRDGVRTGNLMCLRFEPCSFARRVK